MCAQRHDFRAKLDTGDGGLLTAKTLDLTGRKRTDDEARSTIQTPVRVPSSSSAPMGTVTAVWSAPLAMVIVTVEPSGAEAAGPSST